MSHIPEGQIALYVSDDLPEAQAETIEMHLSCCSDCRAILAGFQNVSVGLATLSFPVFDMDVAAVRHGVLAQIAEPRRMRLSLGWVGLVAAATAILIATFLIHPQQPTQIPAHTAASLPPITGRQSLALAIPVTMRHVVAQHIAHRVEAGVRAISLVETSDRQTLMRITTTDPNVLILWQPTERNSNP